IGNAVRLRLEKAAHQVTGLDLRSGPGLPWFKADIADLSAIGPAFAGQDVVVHTAATVNANAAWDDVLRNNIIGTYNVFEAARQARVKRVVYVSSGDTITGWAREMPYRAIVE